MELDLRDRPVDRRRELIFETLEELGEGDELDVVAGDDVDPHLVRYQIERDRALDWRHDDPDAEPREIRVRKGPALGDDELGAIDVRDLKPQRRHEVLLETFDELDPGEVFVLVNDHDPKPLYHELHSMHGDVVGWDYASRDPDEWRVEILKTGASDATDDEVLTRYDVREIPKSERHPTIHHRYGMIPAGETMEIVAPHEPRPLKGEFRQQYGDSFDWDVVADEPGRCRVRITKTGESGGGRADSVSEGCDEVAGATDDEELELTRELDVRDLPPAQRHEQIFEAYADLDGGDGFVLVNDHDPKPLYHQFEAEAGPEFRWEYRQRDPGEFRVVIGKADAAVGGETGERTDAPF